MDTRDKKTNILYISNSETFLGGAAKCLYDLLSHLDLSRYHPIFASIYDGEVAQAFKALGIPYIKLKEFKRANPFPYIYSQLQLMHLIVKNKISIIHNNQCGDTFYAWLPSLFTKARIIIHHRDSKFRKMDAFFIKHADCNICMSSWLNQEFLDHRAILIHDGIDLDEITQSDKAKPTASNASPNQPLTVGLVGRISPIKGQDTFINAAKIILDKKPNIKFVMIGDTNSGYYDEYYQGLVNQISRLGINDHVTFTGLVNGLANIYPNLDISVVPSLREPFGRVIIESMAFGKPVIATNVGGPLDIVTDQTGILIPVNDPQALAEAILFLAENPSIRDSMGKAGLERVRNSFTIQTTLSKIYALYNGLLSN